MKKYAKILGLIAFIAIAGFSMASCDWLYTVNQFAGKSWEGTTHDGKDVTITFDTASDELKGFIVVNSTTIGFEYTWEGREAVLLLDTNTYFPKNTATVSQFLGILTFKMETWSDWKLNLVTE